MPPRLTTPQLGTPSTTALPLQGPLEWQCRRCQLRLLSTTPSMSTRLRRDMFRWLDGPGRALQEALPGSTNYFGAYDRRGRLMRRKEAFPGKSGQNGEETGGAKEGDAQLPPETIEDLRPFPLNKSFYSQSILSEELRNEIYRRIRLLGQPVRLVSAELGIEMRRVGAVVRLVEIEKQWKATVFTPVLQLSTLHHSFDELQNSISLDDPGSLILECLFQPKIQFSDHSQAILC